MKSSADLLEEFQTELTKKGEPKLPAEYYASLAVFGLKDAIIALRKLDNKPIEIVSKETSAKMFYTLVNIGQAAIASDVKLHEVNIRYNELSLNKSFRVLWEGDTEPFFENMLFSVQTHLLFTPRWTMDKLLRASTRLMKKKNK